MHLAKSLAVGALATGLAVSPAFAADPTGTWQTTGGESRYTITYCGDGTQLCAKLVWLREDARTAENLPYLNRYVVKGAHAEESNEWSGTVSYGGDTFSGTLRLTGANQMKLQGCKGVFCQSMKFTRV